MKAVIMAGGQGSRLRPLTSDLPKPMVPIVNKPVMEHIINLLKRHNITEIAITTYYLPEKIKDYFGDGEKWGVDLNYYQEVEPLGTAGSVHNAAEFLDETFVVISGDAVTDFNLGQAIDFHRKKDADATLVLSREEIPLDYGVVITDEGGRITRFLEKPNWGQVFSDTVNTGIYVLEPEIFKLYPANKKYDFSQDLFPLMLKQELNLYGLPLDGYWNDIGSLSEYHHTQFDFLEGKIKLPFDSYRQIDNNVWVAPGVKIHESAKIKGPVLLGEGTVVEEGVILDNCIIGNNCRIASHASVEKSVLWDQVYVGSGAEVRGSVLSDNVVLGDNAAVYEQTALGKKVKVGRESRVSSGVKIWPDREVGERVKVDRSIIWPDFWSRHLFTNIGVVGQANIDITPEFLAALAPAFASLFSVGDSVVVSSDSYQITNALKRVFAGSLQTAGLNVVDIDDSTSAVARYSIIKMGVSGGVHIRLSYHDPRMIVIEMFNRGGVNLSASEQRKVEKIFFAGEYQPLFKDELGEYSYAPGMSVDYIETLINNINAEAIKNNYYNLVVDYEYDNLGDILPLFGKKLNCQLISTRNYALDGQPLSIEERRKTAERVIRIVQDNRADLGFIIDHNGSELILITPQGKIIDGAHYQVLISYLLLERGFKELYLPLNSPEVIGNMAEEYGAKVVYTQVNPQIPMHKYQDNLQRPYFYPYADGVAGLALILEKMAKEGISIEELLKRLPRFYINQAEIPCDWRDKGRVMRHLSKEAPDDEELIDGIKFRHQQGWALVVPDSERPVFRIFTEGQDLETAENLTGFYIDKVKKILNIEK